MFKRYEKAVRAPMGTAKKVFYSGGRVRVIRIAVDPVTHVELETISELTISLKDGIAFYRTMIERIGYYPHPSNLIYEIGV